MRRLALNEPVESLGLSVSAYYRLEHAGIRSIGELATKTQAEIEQIAPGARSLEIEQALAQMGLSFAETGTALPQNGEDRVEREEPAQGARGG